MHDDAYIGGCIVHNNLGWKKQTTLCILPHHWLYEWFSQFHRCRIYSVLSWSPSFVLLLHFQPFFVDDSAWLNILKMTSCITVWNAIFLRILTYCLLYCISSIEANLCSSWTTEVINGCAEELHAEICYTECLLERAILNFIKDENLIGFIKGSLKIKECYSLYK